MTGRRPGPGPGPVTSVQVVVPVHDEQELLPSCLSALQVTSRGLLDRGVPVTITVVLDACSDGSAAVALGAAVGVVRLDAHNVGRARAEGFAAARQAAGSPSGSGAAGPAAARDRTWLATTDADSVVPGDWLARQLEYADGGADLVAGTVAVDDWAGWPARAVRLYTETYRRPGAAGHPHVHGANLGVRASVYDEVGGFAPLATGEDHALVAAVAAAGRVLVRALDLPVRTSARASGRAPAGFSSHLREIRALAG